MPPDASRRGYGRELIERAHGYATRAKTRLAFDADGVSCRIEMPLAARLGRWSAVAAAGGEAS